MNEKDLSAGDAMALCHSYLEPPVGCIHSGFASCLAAHIIASYTLLATLQLTHL
jgi:hypothetical protein